MEVVGPLLKRHPHKFGEQFLLLLLGVEAEACSSRVVFGIQQMLALQVHVCELPPADDLEVLVGEDAPETAAVGVAGHDEQTLEEAVVGDLGDEDGVQFFEAGCFGVVGGLDEDGFGVVAFAELVLVPHRVVPLLALLRGRLPLDLQGDLLLLLGELILPLVRVPRPQGDFEYGIF